MRRAIGVWGAGLAALLLAPVASGQGGEKGAAAEALFKEGKKLFDAKNYAEACPKLAESQRLDPAGGTLMNLGECYVKLGKTASAWSSFLEAASLSASTGNAERERVARKRASEVEPQLAYLAVSVASGAEVTGLEIQRDGIVLGKPQWGTPVPVDPGEHEVTARAPGYKSWSGKTRVEAKGKASLEVPALTKEPTAAPPATSTATGAAPSTTAIEPPPGWPWQKTAAIGLGAAGLVGLGLGSYFGVQAKSRLDDSNSGHCQADNRCDSRGVDLRSQAKSSALSSTILFSVGGAALAGGVILWLIAPTKKAEAAWRVAPGLGPRGASLQMEGSW